MSDVLDEVVSRLKEKAKTANEIIRIICVNRLGYLQYYIPCHDFSTKDKREWIRLEDVKGTLEEILEAYVLVEKNKINELLQGFPIKPLGLGLSMGTKTEFVAWFVKLKELLKT